MHQPLLLLLLLLFLLGFLTIWELKTLPENRYGEKSNHYRTKNPIA